MERTPPAFAAGHLVGRLDHLKLACSLLEASARHGVSRHLSIGHPQAMPALDAAVGRLPGPAARALRPRVDQLLEGLREQALELAGRGGDLPAPSATSGCGTSASGTGTGTGSGSGASGRHLPPTTGRR